LAKSHEEQDPTSDRSLAAAPQHFSNIPGRQGRYYAHRMIGRFVLLLFAALAVAQEATNIPVSGQEPKLPVIDYNACPFEGCTFGKWKVTKQSVLFSAWEEGRTQIGKLSPGEVVTGLTGVHITRMPDKIAVTKSIPDLDAAAGDVILRYMYMGEGTANIWIKGHWHQAYDCTFVTEDEKNGGGCQKDCSATVKEYGVKEWWVKVTTRDRQTGWVLADDNFDGMDSLALLNLQ
jgi:hypothetical protein